MTNMKTRQLVPMTFVADVERSIDFYKHLGFEAGNTFAADGATKPTWAWLQSGGAQLMLAAASEAVVADQQRILAWTGAAGPARGYGMRGPRGGAGHQPARPVPADKGAARVAHRVGA